MKRVADHPIQPLFLSRWSPRAFSDAPLSIEDLSRLFEAARWAPSANNHQPWRFLYSLRDDSYWECFSELPNEKNRRWCRHAAALIVVLSKKVGRTHGFDAGCAWGYLALQAASMGLATHGMAGFDVEKTRRILDIPEDFAIEAMIAVGYPGKPESLPDDLREREHPSSRMSVGQFSREGSFDIALL